MINVDLSKILHPRFWDLVPAFMPGLFFEVCVLCGRPELLYGIVGKAHLNRYDSVIIALVVAFVVGTAFMLWVMLIADALTALYPWGRQRWRNLLAYLLTGGRFASWNYVRHAHQKVLLPELKHKPVLRAVRKAATELLKRRYGLEPPDLLHGSEWHGLEWQVWYAALGTRGMSTARGWLFVVAIQATGWSALAATYFAPALRSLPYWVFSLFLTSYGLLATLRFVRWWTLPIAQSLFKLRAVLDEIPRSSTEEKDDTEAKTGEG
ncbi:MAG: hypothetical protein WA188_10915 [Terriglobales bacterium]